MLPQWIIEKKRDGHQLTEKEIRSLIEGYANDTIPDYQMSAFAMAVYFQGMTFDETAVLTDAMLKSGTILDTSSIPMPKVDKHSTGGVGDKVSILLAPLVASCGLAIPMISGRGLGITGGTLDKLESIPGYRTNLSSQEFIHVLEQCACSIIGQTSELAPVDKKLYALRDVTGTVPSIPLIAASIMSKKLAEGIDSLVLDVKCGSGAFMKTPQHARELAETIVEIGRRMNKNMTAIITDMNQPLGHAVGNTVEIIETVNALQGKGPEDLIVITAELGARLCVLSGKITKYEDAVKTMRTHISSGKAFSKLCEMVHLHGGNVETIKNTSLLPSANLKHEYPSPQKAYVTGIDADSIGRACVCLGAGRRKVDDNIDHTAGITGIVKTGQYMEENEPLLTLHSNDKDKLNEALEILEKAFAFSPEHPDPTPLIMEVIS